MKFQLKDNAQGGLHEEPGVFTAVVREFWYKGMQKNFDGEPEPSGAFIMQVIQEDPSDPPKLFYFWVRESLGNRNMPSKTRKFFNAILGGQDVEDAYPDGEIPPPDFWVSDAEGNNRMLRVVFENYTKRNGEAGFRANSFLPYKGARINPGEYLTHDERKALRESKDDSPPF